MQDPNLGKALRVCVDDLYELPPDWLGTMVPVIENPKLNLSGIGYSGEISSL